MQIPDHNDQNLLQKAKAGDRLAFDALSKRWEGQVRRFTRRLVGPSACEEDIRQDAFIALYMNLDRIPTAESLRPFLFRIVRNLCYDELRRMGRFRTVSLDAKWEESEPAFLFDHRPQPDEEVHWILLYSEVKKGMDRLPETQRQTMILYCEENLSYAEVAEVMGTDIGTVKSRLHYARKNLFGLLTPEVRQALANLQGGTYDSIGNTDQQRNPEDRKEK